MSHYQAHDYLMDEARPFNSSLSTVVIRSYRFRLMPTWRQHRVMERILETQRVLYNAALEERIDTYRKLGRCITRFDQFKSLVQIKSDDPRGYGSLPANLHRETLRRLDEAFNGFFRRVKQGRNPGFPRFRSTRRWDGFGFAEFAGITFKNGGLKFKGMTGALRVHLHRPIAQAARILGCQFRRDAKGWSVSFQVREMIQIPHHAGPAVGLDLGVRHFAALSDGTTIPSLAAARRAASALRRTQRALERSSRTSRSHAVRKRILARRHLKVANTRETFLHQVSAKIARTYSLIGVEKLQVANMARSAKGSFKLPGRTIKRNSALNRSILDAGWGKFTNQIRYKAAWAGGRVVEIDPRFTTQTCSECGVLVAKDLSQRVHQCICGLRLDRDVNAARNILKLALADQYASPSSGFTPGHSGPGPV
jgi:putative transposase